MAFKKFIKHLKMLPKSKQPDKVKVKAMFFCQNLLENGQGKGYVLLQKPIEEWTR